MFFMPFTDLDPFWRELAVAKTKEIADAGFEVNSGIHKVVNSQTQSLIWPLKPKKFKSDWTVRTKDREALSIT